MEDIDRSIEIVKTLKQVMDTIKQDIDCRFKEIGFTGPQGMLIGILNKFGRMKISDLSEKMDLSNSTVSGIVDRLEKQNMLIRTRSEDDRRVVYVELTPECIQLTRERFKEIETIIAGKISKADPAEMDKIQEGVFALKLVMERELGRKRR